MKYEPDPPYKVFYCVGGFPYVNARVYKNRSTCAGDYSVPFAYTRVPVHTDIGDLLPFTQLTGSGGGA